MEEKLAGQIKSLTYFLLRQKEIKNIIGNSLMVHGPDSYFEFIKPFRDDIVASFLTNVFAISNHFNKKQYAFVESIDTIYKICKNISQDYDFSDLKIQELASLARCNIMLNVFLCSFISELEYKDYEGFNFKTFNSFMRIVYRGQSNSKWGLLPSIYRNFKIENGVLTRESVLSIYDEMGLKQLYNSLFKEGDEDKMLSFFQHCLSFSPFLDFSYSLDVAIIFSTCGDYVSINDYRDNDSSIFFLIVYDSQRNTPNRLFAKTKEPSSFRVKWHSGVVTFETKIDGKYLFASDYTFFEIKYTFSKERTNDRMKYQQGCFFVPYDCTIINGHMMIPFNQIGIFKINIPKEEKSKLYSRVIAEHPEYEIDNLMDPYRFFKKSIDNKKDN